MKVRILCFIENPILKYFFLASTSTKVFVTKPINVNTTLQPIASTSQIDKPPKIKNPKFLRHILGFSSSVENFICPLCTKSTIRMRGLTLHSCKHSFCKNCFLTLYSKYEENTLLICPEKNCFQLIISNAIKERLDQRRKEKYEKAPINNWLCHICEVRNAIVSNICKFCDTPKKVKLVYEELLKLEQTNNNLVPNFEEFSCRICFGFFNPGEGIIIRNCFHTFCVECLTDFIKISEVSEIHCPETDCEFYLQDREIRAILSTVEYENYLKKSLNLAENQSLNSFHCKTPNCNVWWIIEENTNQIFCGVCRKISCISCGVCFIYIYYFIVIFV